MHIRKLFGIVLTLWLASESFWLQAKTSRSASKDTASKTSTTKSSTKASSPSSRSRKVSSARTRRSGPPRQTQPSPERYMEVQRALTEKGYYKGEIDGQWNDDAKDALKRFQADQNLAPDGKLGSLSLIALGLGPKRQPLPPEFE